MIEHYNYVTDVFGKQRPINTIESGHAYFNLNKTMIAKAMILGFSQVSKNQNVRALLEKVCK
ncbi:DUF3231 family protein [Priestia megaterium]